MKSNKYSAAKHNTINTKLNKVLLSLINTDPVEYGTDATAFIDQMHNQEMCAYQSSLLHTYLLQPEEFTRLVLDKLDATGNARDKALELVLSQELKQGMLHIRTKYIASIINVEEVPVDKINENFKGSEDEPRPYYTQLFIVSLVDDPDTCFYFYVSDGTEKNSTMGFRFSYNPSRFNDEQTCAVFSHLDSVLGKRRYSQFINNAKVTRIDIAIDLPGVLAAFLICLPEHGKTTRSLCYPLVGNGIRKLVECIYLGRMPTKKDKTKNRASKFRIYDVLLNLFDKQPELIKFKNELSVTTRIEYELIPYQSGAIDELRIRKLEGCPVKLDELRVIDPLGFYLLPRKWLGYLLKNKTISHINKNLHRLKNKLKKGGGEYGEVSLKTGWLVSTQGKLLKHHKLLMQDPKGCQKELGYVTK